MSSTVTVRKTPEIRTKLSERMAPNILGSAATLLLTETTTKQNELVQRKSPAPKAVQKPPVVYVNGEKKYVWDVKWINVFLFIGLHSAFLRGLYLQIFEAQFKTFLWLYFYGLVGGIGITAGAHRLWSHKAYKAKWPLRVLLMIFQTIAFQNHLYEWVRDHRVHHKFTDTDADPHNSQRGFFFSHIGWLMVRKHPDVKNKGKLVDMSDLERDPVVMWQKKYYFFIMPLFAFGIPTFVPWYFFGEEVWLALLTGGILRYTLSLNATWLVNSAAHIWGTKPYDRNISSADNRSVAFFAFGEGWHNYHHVFPWDYKAAELGNYRMNITTAFIDFFAWVGWAYDLKTVPVDMVIKRLERTGDGSRLSLQVKNDNISVGQAFENMAQENAIWGWGDKDMKKEDIAEAQVLHKSDEVDAGEQ